MSASVYVGFMVYSCPQAGCLKDRERNAYREGRKLSLRSSGTTAEKCFIACSHTLIDAYIRPPVLPQQRLKIPKSTISPSLQSVSLSFCPALYTNHQLCHFPLSTSSCHLFLSCLSLYPSLNFALSSQLLSLPWYPSPLSHRHAGFQCWEGYFFY